jgi:hypothetical protein
LPPEEQSKGENIIRMAREGRELKVAGFGPMEGFDDIQRLAVVYAKENMDRVVQSLDVYALGGEPALLAPH